MSEDSLAQVAVQAQEVKAVPVRAPEAAAKQGRSWWFDVAMFLWPVAVAIGAIYYMESRSKDIATQAVQAPPRVLVLDELALIQKVVREERLKDIDTVRRRVSEIVRPYTDAGYVVIGDLNIVAAPNALVLSESDLEALYARSRR